MTETPEPETLWTIEHYNQRTGLVETLLVCDEHALPAKECVSRRRAYVGECDVCWTEWV